MNEEKTERLIELYKKARAGAPPRPHDDHTREHYKQCVECREWDRAVDASFQKVEREEGMISGELRTIIFLAMATKVEALVGPRPAEHAHRASLEELRQCPECQKQDKVRAAAWEKMQYNPHHSKSSSKEHQPLSLNGVPMRKRGCSQQRKP